MLRPYLLQHRHQARPGKLSKPNAIRQALTHQATSLTSLMRLSAVDLNALLPAQREDHRAMGSYALVSRLSVLSICFQQMLRLARSRLSIQRAALT